jgi:hypothetical protein
MGGLGVSAGRSTCGQPGATRSRCQRSNVAGVTKKILHDRRGNSRESAASSTLSPSPRSGRFHPAAQHGDLMPEREDLDLLGPVTAPEQDQELQDTAE